jgi:hypothetical protein
MEKRANNRQEERKLKKVKAKGGKKQRKGPRKKNS